MKKRALCLQRLFNKLNVQLTQYLLNIITKVDIYRLSIRLCGFEYTKSYKRKGYHHQRIDIKAVTVLKTWLLVIVSVYGQAFCVSRIFLKELQAKKYINHQPILPQLYMIAYRQKLSTIIHKS